MRDCIFLVADKNMEAVFSGFLSREQSHRSLGSRPFVFDPDIDLIVDEAGADPGVYHRAHELLRPYVDSHRFAVIALDGGRGAMHLSGRSDARRLAIGMLSSKTS